VDPVIRTGRLGAEGSMECRALVSLSFIWQLSCIASTHVITIITVIIIIILIILYG